MATEQERDRIPVWARLIFAFAILVMWLLVELFNTLGNKPPPSTALNAAFLLTVGAITSNELGRAFARGLRRIVENAEIESKERK